jgi:putative DNA primase/helicase
VLTPEHREFLSSQAVDIELAEARGVLSLASKADLEPLGDDWSGWANFPALAFPWTGTDGRVEWQIRPDKPNQDPKNGKPVKYRFRSGKRGYRPVLWAVCPVDDETTRVLVVEGTKQALAAASYTPADVAVYAIGGCRMWSSEGLPIPDLQIVDGLPVVICLDADAATNLDVYRAGTALEAALAQEGATEVLFTRLVGAGEKDGLDDILATRPEDKRPAYLGRLLAGAKKNPADSRPKGKGGPRPGGAELLPAPTDPMAVARVIEPELKSGDVHTVRNWRGGWWSWQTSHWAETEELAFRKRLYERTENALYEHETTKGVEVRRWAPTKPKVANLADALAGIVHLDRETKQPAWLQSDRPDLGTIVSCRNGLLRLDGRELLAHDPAYFNLVAVPFDYEPDAGEPKAWLEFLESVWPGGGAGQVDALQEWFGYVISGRTDFQKIFAIIGPPRSGKGTIASVLSELAGAANVAGPTLASLATNFGLQPLLGKSLALISDARIGRSVDTSVIVERLLTISGEDVLSVDRKHLTAWEGRIPARIMLLSNELPRFSDGSGTIATRFVVTETIQSFLGREDRSLRGRLLAELPGILNWALAGLERLLDRGYFADTEVSTEAVDVMRQTASPYTPFVEDECVIGAECEVTPEAVWQAWTVWCVRNGRDRTGTVQWLGRDLKSVVPGIRMAKPRGEDGKQHRVWRGLGLKADYPSETRRGADIPIARVAESSFLKDVKEVVTSKGRNTDIRASTRLTPDYDEDMFV